MVSNLLNSYYSRTCYCGIINFSILVDYTQRVNYLLTPKLVHRYNGRPELDVELGHI